jgi:ankyrin repeat protein
MEKYNVFGGLLGSLAMCDDRDSVAIDFIPYFGRLDKILNADSIYQLEDVGFTEQERNRLNSPILDCFPDDRILYTPLEIAVIKDNDVAYNFMIERKLVVRTREAELATKHDSVKCYRLMYPDGGEHYIQHMILKGSIKIFNYSFDIKVKSFTTAEECNDNASELFLISIDHRSYEIAETILKHPRVQLHYRSLLRQIWNNSDMEVIRLLIRHVSIRHLLSFMVYYVHLAAIKYLVHMGYDIEENNGLPLFIAVVRGNVDVVQCLIDLGARKNNPRIGDLHELKLREFVEIPGLDSSYSNQLFTNPDLVKEVEEILSADSSNRVLAPR